MRMNWLVLLLLSWMMSISSEVLAQSQSRAANSSTATGPHIQVSLLSEHTSLVAGTTTHIGVLLAPDPEWHTYWRNPGDSGEAPVITMSSNAALSFGDIQWPVPQAIPVAHLVNYGYEAHNLLMIPVEVPDLLTTQSVDIKADLSWLVCKEDCIPGFATLSLTLPVTEQTELSEFADLFSQTRSDLPQSEWLTGKFEINQDTVVVAISGVANVNQLDLGKLDAWTLFPFRSDVTQHAQPQQWVVDGDIARGVIAKSIYFDGRAETLRGLLSDGSTGVYIETSSNPLGGEVWVKVTELSWFNLLTFAAMAFIGGLLLNLMPCVLPVLSIKALSVHASGQPLNTKFAYLVGVLCCFNLFAITIVALQASGQQVGWGFQMQEPIVIIVLSFLFTYIALLLFGALQVSSRFSGLGESLVSGKGWSSNFFTGVLAVIVASPCTAPFMAAALGVALVSEPYVTLVLFNALALGFGLPLTLLFVSKRFSRILPKPGAWMNTFKQFLAFPMLATVAWLCWVFAGQTSGQAQFGLLIALLLFSMCLWFVGQAEKQSLKRVFTLVALASLAAPLYLAVGYEKASVSSGQSGEYYLPFSPQLLAELKRDNQVVVVNMTADWCITCKVNEQVALADTDVKQILQSDGVHYVVGDWTNKNQMILDYLHQYDRAGVPLYVVYAGDKSVQILPQILTPNTVITAINQAIKEISND